MTDYVLSLNNVFEVPESNGNFSVVKEYIVKSLKPQNSRNIQGIIIQYVKKRSTVVDAENNTYNTSESIENFTNNVVKYSNDDYFEIFEVFSTTGKSKNADEFQNNSLTQYEPTLDGLIPYTYEVGDIQYQTYKTQGEINIEGLNCFISKGTPEYIKITNLDWKTDINTPANGLPYLPYTKPIKDLIFNAANSNILLHKVKVTWSFENPKSVIETEVISPFIIGGKRKNLVKRTIRKRKYRKRKNSKRKYSKRKYSLT